jgi:desulfoferrodoxin ferrous iron-binding domain
MKIFECSHCKNQVFLLNDAGVPMVCCGDPMTKLTAIEADTGLEKHVPACTLDGNKLQVVVGEVCHPMTENHYIQWIAVEQNANSQFAKLSPTDEPKASFIVDADKDFTVYEYCNLHKLWKKYTGINGKR